MREVTTYTATVFSGLRIGYGAVCHPYARAFDLVQEYVNLNGLGCTVTSTTFVYQGGSEPGVSIGLIHYPRFPRQDAAGELTAHALALGRILRRELQQERVSVVLPDRTILLEADGD